MATVQQKSQTTPTSMMQRQPQYSSNQELVGRFPKDVPSKKIGDGANTKTKTIDKENSLNNGTRKNRSINNNGQSRIAFGGSTAVVLPQTTAASNFHPYQTPKQPKTALQRSSTCTTTSATMHLSLNPTNTTTPYSILSMEMNRPSKNSSNRNDNHPQDEKIDSENDDDEDDISLLCSPILPHVTTTGPSTTTQRQRRIQPTKLSSPPERIPINSRAMTSSDRNDQIAIFQTSKPNEPTKSSSSTKATSVTTSSSEIVSNNAQSALEVNSIAPHNGLSRPPLTTRTNDDALLPKHGISKNLKTTMKKQTQTKIVAGTRHVPTDSQQSQRPPRITTTTMVQSDPTPVADTIPVVTSTKSITGNVSTKSTRFAMFAESPNVVSTRSTTKVAYRNSTTTKINPTFSMLHPQHQRTPSASTALRSTYTISTTTRSDVKNQKGICMDLSDIFFDAASKTSVKKARPQEPPSSNRITTSTENGMDGERQNVHESDDQQWAEKQVDMFTKWMNYLFYPTEGRVSSTAEQDGNVSSSTTSALRALVIHQRLAQGRTTAHTLFHSTDMQRIRDILCHEIGRNKIALRPDRDDLYANLDHRNMILSVLLSYSSPWLRLGLETMFHTVISPDMPTLFSPNPAHRASKLKGPPKAIPLSRLKLTLRNFILHNVLSDESVLAKYTGGKCKVPSGPFEDRYRAELRTIVTYRILVLIIFLDRAKMSNVLDQAPNLFTSASTVKSTRDVLLFICRNFLKSEGDFTKHLSRLGIKVQYQQEAVDELDFTVSNLRVDLNDGVRLTRMTELLTGVTLLPKLRLPAVSRLQKLYNVKLAIDHLLRAGVPISDMVAPYHIVDGHREMVLKLLWSVVAHCCLQALLSVEQVEAEISRIQRYHGMTPSPSRKHNHMDDNDLQRALLRWCNLVCSRFGRHVPDFTQAFSDGKAICLLIHYYHPTLIRLKEIRMTSQDALAKYSNPEILLSNERFNGLLANKRMSDLGGIPEVIPVCDTNHPPEEKAVVFCLTFLCSRLITSSVEIRACLIIQNAFRNYRERLSYVFKVDAAKRILFAWRTNKVQYYLNRKLRYHRSVHTIEQFILANKDKIYELRLRRLDQQKARTAAIFIQKIYRGFIGSKHARAMFLMRKAATIIQSTWRKELALRQILTLLKRNDAALVVQRAWRTHQFQDIRKNAAATHIQRLYRGYCSRVEYIIDVLDIIAVQSCVRRFVVLQNYKRLNAASTRLQCTAVTEIQSFWRMKLVRDVYIEMKHAKRRNSAAIVIQSVSRKWIARRTLFQMKFDAAVRRHAVVIQSIWRSFSCRMVLNRLKANRRCTLAATSIQAIVRKNRAKAYLTKLKHMALLKKSAISIQTLWRGQRVRSLCGAMHFAATLIQATWRRSVAIRQIHFQHCCAIRIQSHWRQIFTRKSFRSISFAIRRIQSVCRTFLVKTKCKQRQAAVHYIQCKWRRWISRRKLQKLKNLRSIKVDASVIVQRFWRGFRVKNIFRLVKRDAVVIQRFYRSYHLSRRFIKTKKAALIAQSMVRQFLARKHLIKLVVCRIETERSKRIATLRLQAIFRGAITRGILRCRSHSAIEIQRCFRGSLAKLNYRRSVDCIIRAQSIVRRWLTYRIVSRREGAIIRVQCLARKLFAQCELRNLTLSKQRAASELSATLTIQKMYRGMRGRQVTLFESSARKIQKTWRCYTVHVEYMLSILAAIDIQTALRRFNAISSYKRRYAAIVCLQSFTRLTLTKVKLRRETQCAVTLQSFARMVHFRNTLDRKKVEYASALLIQRKFRDYLSRSLYVFVSAAAVTLQRCIRGFLLRLQLETEVFAAVEIQRIWLGFVAREYFAWNVLAAIKLQSYVRGQLGRSRSNRIRSEQAENRFLAVQSAIKIQHCYREYRQYVKEIIAVTMIQRMTKRFLSRRTFGRVRESIVRAQGLARGFVARRKRSKKVTVQARRIGMANKKALATPNMKLGCRTRDALDVLVNSKSLTEIMDAVCVLEVATRLSEICCSTFAEAKAPDLLFFLIQTCNRSLPHLKLLQYILQTLSNVARFDKFVPTMASLSGVEVFLDLLQMFRDKDYVFCLVVSLLERIVRSNFEKVLKFISKENLKRLQGVRDLCIRKHSVSGIGTHTHRRTSCESSKRNKDGTIAPDIRKGIKRLQLIIHLIEKHSTGNRREGGS